MVLALKAQALLVLFPCRGPAAKTVDRQRSGLGYPQSGCG
jgi:hypothetical protein